MVKRYSQRFICIISVLMCLLVAVFYPFDVFYASSVPGTPVRYDISFSNNSPSFNYRDGHLGECWDYNISSTEYDYNYIYFHKALNSKHLFTTSKDVYAYKIDFLSVVTDKAAVTNCQSYQYMMFGTYSDNLALEGVKSDLRYGLSRSTWLVTDYAEKEIYALNYGQFFQRHDTYKSNNVVTSTYPSYDIQMSLVLTVTPYTINDLSDELYKELKSLVSGNAELLEELEKIYTSVDTVEAKIDTLINYGKKIMSSLDSINLNTDNLESLITVANEYLDSIHKELEDQTAELKKSNNWLSLIAEMFQEFLFGSGDESLDEMSDTSMNEALSKEDTLLNNANPEAAAADLSVTIDASANATIWSIINDLVTCNSVVFGSFLSILSLGVIALILNR